VLGEFWVIAHHRAVVVRNFAMLHDIAAIGGSRTTSWWFLIMFKNLAAIPVM
jgi:hypothetical protein